MSSASRLRTVPRRTLLTREEDARLESQDRRVFLDPLGIASGIAEMLACLPVVNADPQRSEQLIQRCQAVLAQTPCYRLHFLPEPSFWSLVFAAMEPNIEPAENG